MLGAHAILLVLSEDGPVYDSDVLDVCKWFYGIYPMYLDTLTILVLFLFKRCHLTTSYMNQTLLSNCPNLDLNFVLG